jgi:hypothetical protein
MFAVTIGNKVDEKKTSMSPNEVFWLFSLGFSVAILFSPVPIGIVGFLIVSDVLLALTDNVTVAALGGFVLWLIISTVVIRSMVWGMLLWAKSKSS